MFKLKKYIIVTKKVGTDYAIRIHSIIYLNLYNFECALEHKNFTKSHNYARAFTNEHFFRV